MLSGLSSVITHNKNKSSIPGRAKKNGVNTVMKVSLKISLQNLLIIMLNFEIKFFIRFSTYKNGLITALCHTISDATMYL
jgi:hypothetical protein